MKEWMWWIQKAIFEYFESNEIEEKIFIENMITDYKKLVENNKLKDLKKSFNKKIILKIWKRNINQFEIYKYYLNKYYFNKTKND